MIPDQCSLLYVTTICPYWLGGTVTIKVERATSLLSRSKNHLAHFRHESRASSSFNSKIRVLVTKRLRRREGR